MLFDSNQLILNMLTIMSEEWQLLNWISKNKKIFLLLIFVVIVVAGILDIKYEGLFFQLLPTSIQTFLSNLF
ncbi:hypothetical protein CD31_12480 [Lysinibacillus boronitolerans JCM 21713 = 10a = NBRC 103108]|uniref:Uncharacterized protein n=1 Tax=Lysinibacillus boronitolerans JCM 21713 = 10a = NBRC 103108 TaxID=1294264 RepID=A0ABR4XYZ5_9BACI|nr:hypothetical protein CD31_12480 [Lysinibacillus boronitolerans JCM 21713 = 10a = NBRC 103108]